MLSPLLTSRPFVLSTTCLLIDSLSLIFVFLFHINLLHTCICIYVFSTLEFLQLLALIFLLLKQKQPLQWLIEVCTYVCMYLSTRWYLNYWLKIAWIFFLFGFSNLFAICRFLCWWSSKVKKTICIKNI